MRATFLSDSNRRCLKSSELYELIWSGTETASLVPSRKREKEPFVQLTVADHPRSAQRSL